MLDRILKVVERILPAGVGKAARVLLEEISIFGVTTINSTIASRRYREASNLKLQIGCGPRVKTGWVNVDLEKAADLRLDLRRPLPFPNNSCEIVYSEHFLEHIDYPEPVTSLVRECFRVLQPGGVFSLAVPDIELVLRSYVNGGTPEYYEAQRRWAPSWYTTHMEHINYNFRQDGEHRFAYDVETMTKLLQNAGFAGIARREFDPALDSTDRIVGSLYMKARKP